jgi:hypothetical protein
MWSAGGSCSLVKVTDRWYTTYILYITEVVICFFLSCKANARV